MKIFAAILCLGFTAPSFANVQQLDEGGVGVRNGGSAIYCPQFGGEVLMLEVSEALSDPGSSVPEIENRVEFLSGILNRLRSLDSAEGATLASLLNTALRAHGPVESWPESPVRIATIIHEDLWNSHNAEWVDWLTGNVHLKNGCIILPVSYLTPSPMVSFLLPPRAVKDNLALLSPYNRNVLELHEALYDLFWVRNHTLTVLPTRRLIRRLINRNTPSNLLQAEVESFLARHHLAGN